MTGPGRQPNAPPPGVLVLHAALVFGMLLVAPAVLREPLAWFLEPDSSPMAMQEFGFVLFALASLLALALAVVLPRACSLGPAAAPSVLAVYLPFLVAWTALLVGYLRLMHAVGEPVSPQWSLEYFAGGDPGRPGFWIGLLAVTVLGPMVEEVAFRGQLQTALRSWMGAGPAIVATAAAFGLLHGLPYALPVGVLGLLFGWLRERHGSLLAPVLAHCVHNAIAAVVTIGWPTSLEMLYPR